MSLEWAWACGAVAAGWEMVGWLVLGSAALAWTCCDKKEARGEVKPLRRFKTESGHHSLANPFDPRYKTLHGVQASQLLPKDSSAPAPAPKKASSPAKDDEYHKMSDLR